MSGTMTRTPPVYSHPFTLSQAIELEPALITQEMTRLQHSIQHLQRSNLELVEYLEQQGPEEEFELSIKENQVTMQVIPLDLPRRLCGSSGATQRERIEILNQALKEQSGVDGSNGHYELASARTNEGTLRSETIVVSSEEAGLNTDASRNGTGSGAGTEDEEGMYL